MEFGYSIIFVQNVPETVSFYERAFGLEKEFSNKSFARLATGATKLAFGAEANEASELPDDFEVRWNRADAAAPASQISFITDDVEAAYARAVEAGAVSVVAPRQMPWGQTICRVRDLNGHLVSLATPPKF